MGKIRAKTKSIYKTKYGVYFFIYQGSREGLRRKIGIAVTDGAAGFKDRSVAKSTRADGLR
jgi:hypothetical protein